MWTGMEAELGDNQYIAEKCLGQLPSVRPLAPGELHRSELPGTGRGHRVAPNCHSFGQEQKAFGEKGSIPFWVPSHLDIYQVERNSLIPKGRNSTQKRTTLNVLTCAHTSLHTHATHTCIHHSLWGYFLTYMPNRGLTLSPQDPLHTHLGQHLLTPNPHTPHSQACHSMNPLTPSSQ